MKKIPSFFLLIFGLELIFLAVYFKKIERTKDQPLGRQDLLLTQKESSSFFLSPDSGEFSLNEEFTVLIMLSTGQKPIIGADAILKYDPQKLAVLEILPGDIFGVYPQEKIADGKILISGILQSKEGFSGQGVLAKTKLRGKMSGETRLSFEFTPGRTDDSNLTAAGKDTLARTENGLYTFK